MKTYKTLIVAQSGGPTPVFNASLAGIVRKAQEKGFTRILGLVHGLEGAINNQYIDLSNLSERDLILLEQTPSAALGGSRYPFFSDTDYQPVLEFLTKEQADVFLFLGGNGTMGTCHTMLRLLHYSKKHNSKLVINGVPKTVDNDLYGMEYAPGYLSAARYVALATKAQAYDLKAMRRFEQVRILETMGRAVGWLTAASVLARQKPEDAPHLIYIPEVAIDIPDFLEKVKQIHAKHGYALVVVGEGMKDTAGNPIGYEQFRQEDADPTKVHRPIFIDAAKYLADTVKKELGLTSRAQNLGMVQRAFSETVSVKDRLLAKKAGEAAVEASVTGMNGRMIWAEGSLPLEMVAGQEQFLPNDYYNQDAAEPTKAFVNWLKPLIGDLPEYISFDLP